MGWLGYPTPVEMTQMEISVAKSSVSIDAFAIVAVSLTLFPAAPVYLLSRDFRQCRRRIPC